MYLPLESGCVFVTVSLSSVGWSHAAGFPRLGHKNAKHSLFVLLGPCQASTLTVLRPPRCERVKVKPLSCVRHFATPWTVAHQAPPSTEFSRQEYWTGLPFPSPGDLPDPGIEPRSPALQADALPSEPPGKPSALWGKPKLAQLERPHGEAPRL